MKSLAAILLFLFVLVQAGPAVSALFSDSTRIFMVDEEKGEKKIEEIKKSIKEFPFTLHQSLEFSHQINTAMLLAAEKIQAPPCLEELTPPPNFC